MTEVATKAASLDGIRVRAELALRFASRLGRTVLASARESGGYKVRTPNRADRLEAAIINTGGGIAGGDRVRVSVHAARGARAVLTTPAAERVYGALGNAPARYDARLDLEEEAGVDWLPQETILFDRSRLRRSISADLAAGSRLLIAETVIFGRTASAERLADGLFADTWRIRRGGHLVFAEDVRLDGEVARTLDLAAVAGGASAVATVLLACETAETRLQRVREALPRATAQGCVAAASAWNGLLVVRVLAGSGSAARGVLETVLPVMGDAPLPRVWAC